MNSRRKHIAIIGGGIVGLGAALAISERFPRESVVVLEKEEQLARHQTGHNSGVIHAGIYYKPGSQKAKLCVSGARLLTQFCDTNGVKYDRCGKLIVATREGEVPRLQDLYDRGAANGIPGLLMIPGEKAREIEPHVTAVKAIYSPSTAIVDFLEVSNAMAAQLAGRGVEILKRAPVRSIRRQEGLLYLEAGPSTIAANHLISCAGLHSDRIARLMGIEPDVRIIPFRGEYYNLRPGCDLIRGLIYPVPDPQFPFLGVHFTKRINGPYEAGPNAVLAFAREGYRKTDLNIADAWGMLTYAGFWSMARRYWRMGFYEYHRSLSRGAFLRALQRLVPELKSGDMAPGGSGVRAQAVKRDGSMVDDFQILEAPHTIHVLNAPSPAATASLAIGGHIAELAARSFDLR